MEIVQRFGEARGKCMASSADRIGFERCYPCLEDDRRHEWPHHELFRVAALCDQPVDDRAFARAGTPKHGENERVAGAVAVQMKPQRRRVAAPSQSVSGL